MVHVIDAVVVGAGPAGLAAAITLADANRSVVVIDKAGFPRDKVCGDGLTALALRYYEQLHLDPGTVASWTPVDTCHVRSPSGREVAFPLPDGVGHHAVIARRRDLDAAFVTTARSRGIEVREHAACLGVEEGRDHMAIDTPTGTLHSRYLIAADGMWSPTRRFLGGEPDRNLGEWHAVRQYFEQVSGPAAEELWVWFDADLLPGYAWSFPVGDGRANVGFGVLRDGSRKGTDLRELWDGLVERPHIRAALGPTASPEGAHRAWPIPARVTDVDLTVGSTLFVGDAAAATDPMTGEGIGQALLTGVEAGRAISDGGTASEVTDRYREAVRRHLFADHHMAVGLGHLLSRPVTARAAVRIAGTSDWTRRNFARWLFEDYPRAAVVTPRRWHRGLFTGPGAYGADGST
ncbi:MAG: geranylgeranyl reductase family protein [Acidimicrobiales bacterium]